MTYNEYKKYISSDDLKSDLLVQLHNDIESDSDYEIEDIIKETAKDEGYLGIIHYGKWNEREYVVDVKGKGWPSVKDITNILSKRYKNIDKNSLHDFIEDRIYDLFWKEIQWNIESYNENNDIEIHQYGRSSGYWGIDLKNLNIEINEEKLINKVTDLLSSEDVLKYIYDNFNLIEKDESSILDSAEVYLYNQIETNRTSVMQLSEKSKELIRSVDEFVTSSVEYFSDQNNWAESFISSYEDELNEVNI